MLRVVFKNGEVGVGDEWWWGWGVKVEGSHSFVGAMLIEECLLQGCTGEKVKFHEKEEDKEKEWGLWGFDFRPYSVIGGTQRPK